MNDMGRLLAGIEHSLPYLVATVPFVIGALVLIRTWFKR